MDGERWANKQVTGESITRLFHILTGSPLPGAELTEAQREAREKQKLNEQVLRDIKEHRGQEKFERLIKALEISVPSSIPDVDVGKLYQALTG
jgi:hypothetical protein